MAKVSSNKKKATIWYDQVVDNNKGDATFARVQRPLNKRQRRGF